MHIVLKESFVISELLRLNHFSFLSKAHYLIFREKVIHLLISDTAL